MTTATKDLEAQLREVQDQNRAADEHQLELAQKVLDEIIAETKVVREENAKRLDTQEERRKMAQQAVWQAEAKLGLSRSAPKKPPKARRSEG